MSGDAHTRTLVAQLRAHERDEDLPDDIRERAGKRADELEGDQ